MKQKVKSQHRIIHHETSMWVAIEISAFAPGDIVVRQGTPCIICNPPSDISIEGKVWITNLLTGGCWPVPARESVYPAYEIDLAFSCPRRGDS